LAVASRDGKQYGVGKGAASINKTTCLVAKQTNTHVLRTPCHYISSNFKHVLVLHASLI